MQHLLKLSFLRPGCYRKLQTKLKILTFKYVRINCRCLLEGERWVQAGGLHLRVSSQVLQLLWGAVSWHHLHNQVDNIRNNTFSRGNICHNTLHWGNIYHNTLIWGNICHDTLIWGNICRIRRRPLFYVFNMIMPCVLINGIGQYLVVVYHGVSQSP